MDNLYYSDIFVKNEVVFKKIDGNKKVFKQNINSSIFPL